MQRTALFHIKRWVKMNIHQIQFLWQNYRQKKILKSFDVAMKKTLCPDQFYIQQVFEHLWSRKKSY